MSGTYVPGLGVQIEGKGEQVIPELDFFEPILRDTDVNVGLPEVEALVPTLQDLRLVIFGGAEVSEKQLFAKYLAWHLSSLQTCRILQWHSRASLVQLSAALDRYDAETLFLFAGLQPHHLGGYDLRRLVDQLASAGHYAIVTTDSQPDAWAAPTDWVRGGVWRDAERIRFDGPYLVDILLQRLDDHRDRLPASLRERVGDLDPSSVLADGWSLEKIAGKLGTPSRIRTFVLTLCRQRQPEYTDESVRHALAQTLDDRGAARGWFRSQGPREQLLVLGLSWFHGMLDSQVFAALETVVEQVWRSWDPNLGNFDYHELAEVSDYFEGTRNLTRPVSIECSSQAWRRVFFELAWQLHRRRLLAMLPRMAEWVRSCPDDEQENLLPRARSGVGSEGETSGEERGEDGGGEEDEADEEDDGPEHDPPRRPERDLTASRWLRAGRFRDLFGSRLHRQLFRECIAGTLSHVGRLSPDAVDPVLLEMAQSARTSVQQVPALALAMWRELDPGGEGDRRLFALLKDWQSESHIRGFLTSRFRDVEETKRMARVRATIALTVGRAALYDPPNHLESGLVQLFEKLLADPSPIVRSRLALETVPWLTACHLRQLEVMLRTKAAPKYWLVVSLGLGLANAHHLRASEATPVVEDWHRRGLEISASDGDPERRRLRTHLLAIVAYALGKIVPDPESGGFSQERIFQILGSLLEAEADPVIRKAVLAATLVKAHEDFGGLEDSIQAMMEDLDLGERSWVVEQLTRLYLEQRRRLRPAAGDPAGEPDEHHWIEGVRYPLWLRSETPLTQVEKVLHDWMTDGWRPAAAQVAIRTLGQLTETEVNQRERARREELERQESEELPEPTAPEPVVKTPVRQLQPTAALAVLAVAPWSPEQRRALRATLPEYLKLVAGSEANRRNAARKVWNRGRVRWGRLADPGVLRALVFPKRQEHPLEARLRVVDEPRGAALAGKLRWAERLYRGRWLWFLLLVVGSLVVAGRLLAPGAGA